MTEYERDINNAKVEMIEKLRNALYISEDSNGRGINLNAFAKLSMQIMYDLKDEVTRGLIQKTNNIVKG